MSDVGASSSPLLTPRIAIIGGGPSGLVTLKTLLSGVPSHFQPRVSLFEAEESIGGTFKYRSYQNGQLVSSKQLTAFSDFRLPLDAPDHLSLEAYVQYLEDYTSHFKLKQKAQRFELASTKGQAGVGHVVQWRGADGKVEEDTFDQIAVCAGLHVTPAFPDIPGLPIPQVADSEAEEAALTPAQQRIKAMHSSIYKAPHIFKEKSVLILGTGETGMDLAFAAVKGGAKEIVMSTRQGFLSFPAVLENFTFLGVTFDRPTPIDGLITNLFETSHVHPWVARSHLRWFVSDMIIKRVLWVLTGTMAGCNQWVGELPPHRLGRAYSHLNKSNKAIPYLNKGNKNRPWIMEKIAKYLDPPHVREDEPGVELAPFPELVDEDGRIRFLRNERKEDFKMRSRTIKPDLVMFATGYQQSFPFFDETYPVPAQATCRDIFSHDDPSIAFIGYVRPGVGAIPPQSELAAQLWTLVISGQLEAPTSKAHYHLLTRPEARLKYGVDYSSYVSQLARDMGCEPRLRDLYRDYGLQILFIFCFAAAFPTLYRLEGPWKSSTAPQICRTEILETITRRGVGGNLMMGVIPMIFYALVTGLAHLWTCQSGSPLMDRSQQQS
ncbi:FAD/NAD-P-binding domain-containing protein [Ceraceosorus guamensis]|uniref:FAD/NAD-P-binding domain-containing protein n=1 Tax=Ceraceosorus guamensis TaxID=1522189 RepID=A0A316VRA2_9BASI|nr:FAD/NAD-P-binding domain-containing protein [Ceraceosorus guamensis]PWN40042.1 FAD/NAD-P-binding domain-containing protein [Ceraceosorus guamensis]